MTNTAVEIRISPSATRPQRTWDDHTWRDQAECRTGGHDSELWFAEGVTKAARDARRTAKTICHTCPVEATCLAYAMAVEPPDRTLRFGVYGGLTSEERAKLGKRGTAA